MAHPRAGPRAQRARADGNGVTARVRAAWAVRSPRRIRLSFREAALGELRPSARLEAALAPAALPRTWLTHRLLLGLQEVRRRPGPGRGLSPGGSRPACCVLPALARGGPRVHLATAGQALTPLAGPQGLRQGLDLRLGG